MITENTQREASYLCLKFQRDTADFLRTRVGYPCIKPSIFVIYVTSRGENTYYKHLLGALFEWEIAVQIDNGCHAFEMGSLGGKPL